MTHRYRVETRMQNTGRWRAREAYTGVDLGAICWNQNERAWHVAFLAGKAAISRLPTLEGVRLELGRYCQANPGEIDALYRTNLAARDRATSPEPQEPAPELQGVMGL